MTLCLLSLDLGTAFCDHALLLWKGGVFLTMEDGPCYRGRVEAGGVLGDLSLFCQTFSREPWDLAEC